MTDFLSTWGPVFAAIGAIFVIVWRALRKLVHISDALPALLELAQEFKPNGGSSMRDKVDAIMEGQYQHTELLIEHTAQDESRFNKLEKALKKRK